MGISSHDFLCQVIQPTLQSLGVNSPGAEQLLLATAHFQSGLGQHLQWHDSIGIYGISAPQHLHLWDRHLAFDADLASQIRGMASQHEFLKNPHLELATNLRYATAIAWMIYRFNGANIPDTFTAQDLSRCWQHCFGEQPGSNRAAADFLCSYHELLRKQGRVGMAA